ncbi:NAD(P)(+) transhydrogenase (Re/Si-specific) subunit beta [Gemmatimonas groenlandica]|uniref:NAD(P) transhydrogenase subunit beta n=1 Tax=Gemmatimonas groenlandica TaxID=2732249 RepID=A0A6M4ISE0_9BACT|nr:NAD(P)(+) transhydrogenase (Re/Si-specific) subunit beta [Gemmatimonas groenlandica]QJR36659.1 NAD(P)(+) transhydrogenase (Re/Si-specific) subunit beta [Gemmatimonas groenlandica]
MQETIAQLTYLVASVLFILGLRSLTKPDEARRGMQLAALGMLLAIIGTMLHQEILTYTWIVTGLIVGTLIGYPLGKFVPMTAMPQRIAFSHMFGALAATLVGIGEFYHMYQGDHPTNPSAAESRFKMAAIGFEVLFGALTVSGSFMAFGKLQEFITGRPVTFKGQNLLNGLLFLSAVGCLGWLIYEPSNVIAFYSMVAIAFAIGFMLVIPIGGADMPVVVSLLNSYAGLAASATGFAIGNNVLIIAGALDGASGFILSIIMSKAMNRSFGNVLFGAFGSGGGVSSKKTAEGLTAKSISAEDAAVLLGYASKVIVVPGYGMAVAQAQHQVRELAELIEKKGGEVKYAIHPVAGRMPGHMNVLLAEANVPYDRMYDMEEINDQFAECDVAIVIGANDVVNPAAKTDPGSPIYGMPILRVSDAKSVIVLKRSMNTGFAGIENELFFDEKTSMLFGDAKASLSKLVSEVKQL